MELSDLQRIALEVDEGYGKLGLKNGHKERVPLFYLSCLMGDLGDLSKLVLGKEKYRGVVEGVDEKIKHELCDCLWFILVLAEKLNVNLEKSFPGAMGEIKTRFDYN